MNVDEPLEETSDFSETDTESNVDEVSSGDILGEISPEQTESVDETYYEQVIAELKVMNELTAKVYTCNLIILSLIVFFFFYRLIKNNITRHFT